MVTIHCHCCFNKKNTPNYICSEKQKTDKYFDISFWFKLSSILFKLFLQEETIHSTRNYPDHDIVWLSLLFTHFHPPRLITNRFDINVDSKHEVIADADLLR